MTALTLRRTVVAMAVLAAVAGLAIQGTARAAGPAESNKGGEVRGTTRADERAGVHGDQGRDRAQANKTKAKGSDTKSAGGGAPK